MTTRVITTLVCVLGMTASAAAQTNRKLAALKQEPGIRAVQEAALRYYGLDQDAVGSMATRAGLKALMPVFEVSGGYVESEVDDDTINTSISATEVWVARGVAGSAKDIRGKLAWNLPQLIFNPEELDVKSLSGAREDVITKITDIYYARRHLQVDMVLNPPADATNKLNSQLRLEKLTSLIDAMTGGWFGKKLDKESE